MLFTGAAMGNQKTNGDQRSRDKLGELHAYIVSVECFSLIGQCHAWAVPDRDFP